MNILLKSAKVIHPKSEYHNRSLDILIHDGTISEISETITPTEDTEVIQRENLHVSPGWIDSSVSLGEPGYEERETIDNGLKTAAISGFTAVVTNPNTFPVADTNADIAFLKAKAQKHATALYPIGALTAKSESIDLAELFDMKNAGAVAFGDYKKSISNPNLLKIALQYTRNFGGLVLSFPNENKISGKGVMNEGATSTRLGLKGIPALAEELHIARDLFILEYTGGKLHIPTISTAKSVQLIREAKEKGLDVSCSAAIPNLLFTDETLQEFNTNFKLLPPLRSQDDANALIEGLKEGIIDFVTSDHNPIDIEHKNVEFDHAMYGSIGLESAFGALQTILGTETAISLLCRGRERFGIEENDIQVGQKADLSLFNPDEEYTFDEANILSLSKNSAYIGTKLKGRGYGIIANGKSIISR
ncbi:dihydroorotase [Sinomicrobium weinanense]|uniref:Dihydroorotase n=1 Tax=Sinomicrobium weinanense TaxID=2842200 RepID=A0A926JP42_9FLAO|nr:dihydroorotase [Sinomicrobium weinanense]MBC9794729.1 dihydroorotase [Sinomicrobium weinanense]MBU3124988.1 dihydroorotase [Sinomicrobium weinanense]